jgi:hypothetical protein
MAQKIICVDANFVVFLVKADSETSPFKDTLSWIHLITYINNNQSNS